MTVADSPVAPGFWAKLGIYLIGSGTSFVLAIRKLATWFKSNYWHAFVCGMLAMWIAMLSYDVVKHPLSWLMPFNSAQKMIGLPVTVPPVADDAVVEPVKVDAPAKAEKKHKRTKNHNVRTNDASLRINGF